MTQNERFCPNCGSENVEPDFRRTNVLGEMIFNQNKWVCNDCGYTGIMPSGDPDQDFEEGEEEIEFEEVEQDRSVDAEAGSAYFWYYVKIFLPATIVFILLMLLLINL